MEFNAITAGITPDGIKNRTDIKALICGLISRSSEKITKSEITDIICGCSVVNYFELCSAVDELCTSGNILIGGDGKLELSRSCKEVSDECWTRLPLTVREKTDAALTRLCTMRRSERENDFRSEKIENGYRVECIINSGREPLMSIAFTVPDRSYVDKVYNQFHSDPERIYLTVLSRLTGEDSIAPKE